MEKQKYCRYCGKRILKKGNRVYYCSEWCSRQWHYENQDYLFYTPGVKQEKCVVCGKDLLPRQLKYCSKAYLKTFGWKRIYRQRYNYFQGKKSCGVYNQ